MPTRLTAKAIAALEPPAKGNHVAWDSEVTGLGARITARARSRSSCGT